MSQQLKRKGDDKSKSVQKEAKSAAPAMSEEAINGILEKADAVLEELAVVDQKIEAEVLEIHKKFWSEKQPLLSKRNAILKDIPNFWHTALNNHPSLTQMFNKLDNAILQSCTSIESDESNPKSGFNLIFHFKPNKYFNNKSLSVELALPKDEPENSDDEDDDVQPTITPSKVEWKDAKLAGDDDSVFVNVFEKKEMAFILQMIHELTGDPVAAFRGEFEVDGFGDDGDDDEDDEDDE